MKSSLLVTASLLTGLPIQAEFAAPDATGVGLGHIDLSVRDVDAERRFFIDVMGGTPVENERIPMIQLPGVFLVIAPGDPRPSSAGPTLNRFGIVLKHVTAHSAKCVANHLIVDHAENPKAGYVHSPSGLRIEFFEDASLRAPIAMNHIPGTNFSVGVLPQGNSAASPVLSEGGPINHIGFEVKNLRAFVRRAEANGTKFDEPYHVRVKSRRVHTSFLTGPWSTRIELTEGLAP